VPEIFSADNGKNEANLWRRLFLKTKIYKNIKAKEIAKKVFVRFRDWQNEGFSRRALKLLGH
jgi:hypothetical protein